MTNRDRAATPPPDSAGDELLADYEAAHKTKLTPVEIAGVRDLLKRRERWEWIASTFKTWAVWIVAIVAGWNVGLDGLRKVLKALIGN